MIGIEQVEEEGYLPQPCHSNSCWIHSVKLSNFVIEKKTSKNRSVRGDVSVGGDTNTRYFHNIMFSGILD